MEMPRTPSWAYGLVKHCILCGKPEGSKGAAPATAGTAVAQERHFCYVTAVKNETCTSEQGKHTLLSPRTPLCHKLSLTHPQRAWGVPVLAGGLSWLIGEITPRSVGEHHRE